MRRLRRGSSSPWIGCIVKLNAYPQHTLVCKDPFATGSEELEEVLSLLASEGASASGGGIPAALLNSAAKQHC